MSILITKSHLNAQGGAEKYTWRIAKAFMQKNHPVTLFTDDVLENPLSNQEKNPLLKIVVCPLSSKWGYQRLCEYAHFCAAYAQTVQARVILGMDRTVKQTHLRASNGVHAAYLEHRQREKGLLHQWGYALNPLHRTLLSLEKEGFEHPELKALITNSFMVREEILRFYQTDPKKIHVIHNGVEWKEMEEDFLNWPQGRLELSQKLSLDPHLHHFVFIGHNYERKGLKKLLYALSLLPKGGFHLSVVGKEKKEKEFIHLGKKLGLGQKVSFYGSTNAIRPFYQLADTLVIPSLYDPFANVTIEALSMGVFVVTSKTNGGHEVLNASSGITVDTLREEELFSALQKALLFPKTKTSALEIRESVAHLDFSLQLPKLLDLCLL